MNKTKKNGTFMLLKIAFPVRGSPKEFLKQSMMIENNVRLSEIFHFLNMYLAFLIVADILAFPYTSRYIPASWNNIKSPLLLHHQN